MIKLSNEELSNVSGGIAALKASHFAIIGGVITFLIGAVNGFLRPLSCSSEK